jgi:hypothetical protein
MSIRIADIFRKDGVSIELVNTGSYIEYCITLIDGCEVYELRLSKEELQKLYSPRAIEKVLEQLK